LSDNANDEEGTDGVGNDSVLEVDHTEPSAPVVEPAMSSSDITELPRRSGRITAGRHSNPHHLPKSAALQECRDSTVLGRVDPVVLAQITQTNLLVVQMMAGVPPSIAK
jgi:hypothetical protein